VAGRLCELAEVVDDASRRSQSPARLHEAVAAARRRELDQGPNWLPAASARPGTEISAWELTEVLHLETCRYVPATAPSLGWPAPTSSRRVDEATA
jgi:hypothetical protein